MPPITRYSSLLLSICAVSALVSGPAAAESYPAKPINVIVPFPAGGATDAAARLVTTHLGQVLGQTMPVENVGGASGAIAAQRAARATPDGYTLLAGTINDVVLAPITNPGAGYKHDSFAPVGGIGATSFVLVANLKVPATNIDELLAHVRKQPGKINVGIPGIGTLQHVAVSMLEQQAKLDWTTVPYKGAAPLNADLLGGQIDLAVVTLPSAIPHIREGKLRSLGLMSGQRDEVHKDLPTINEGQELKGLATDAWIGLFAPAKTPAATVEKLNAALQQALNKPEVKDGLAKLGFRASGAVTPAAFRQLVEQDDVRYRRATAGIRFDR